jgi:hypothetical protein
VLSYDELSALARKWEGLSARDERARQKLAADKSEHTAARCALSMSRVTYAECAKELRELLDAKKEINR